MAYFTILLKFREFLRFLVQISDQLKMLKGTFVRFLLLANVATYINKNILDNQYILCFTQNLKLCCITLKKQIKFSFIIYICYTIFSFHLFTYTCFSTIPSDTANNFIVRQIRSQARTS